MRRINWSTLVRQIEKHRAGSALFFKPVCVIAAIDLADEGKIVPDDINAQAVVERFSDYITPFYQNRGKDGFKPLWYLTHDRLWTFFDGERPLDSKDFPGGAPASGTKLFNKFDRLAINESLKELWNSHQERRALRASMLLMLEDSDASSRRLTAALFDPQYLQDPNRWPSDSFLKTYFKSLRDQLSLFDEEQADEPTANLSPDETFAGPTFRRPPVPEALDNVPSPIDYVWVGSRIAVGPNSGSIPVFPNAPSAYDYAQRREACAVQAQDLIQDLSRRRWQVREEYETEIKRYLERLPTEIGSGNILVTDAIARKLRDLFTADHENLPAPFAVSLKAFLQQHIALRPFYPALDNFYRAVKTGRIEDPLPLDAVSEVIGVVRAQTPAVFDESVSEAILEVSSPEPQTLNIEPQATEDEATSPPPDPLGELDATKAHEIQTAGWINNLWKVLKAGPSIRVATEAWITACRDLREPVTRILVWLSQYLGH